MVWLKQDLPDFDSASTKDNSWDYLQSITGDGGDAVDGATGIALTGADVNAYYNLNDNPARWICLKVTAYTAGTVTAFLRAVSEK